MQLCGSKEELHKTMARCMQEAHATPPAARLFEQLLSCCLVPEAVLPPRLGVQHAAVVIPLWAYARVVPAPQPVKGLPPGQKHAVQNARNARLAVCAWPRAAAACCPRLPDAPNVCNM